MRRRHDPTTITDVDREQAPYRTKQLSALVTVASRQASPARLLRHGEQQRAFGKRGLIEGCHCE